MTRFSNSALLAWKIAAREAQDAGAGFIEKEHLFNGILSLDKVIEDPLLVPDAAARMEITLEWDAIFSLLQVTGHDQVVLRRLMRLALPHLTPGLPGTVMHRSPACKSVFDLAERKAGTSPVTSTHLFSAIMEQPGAIIAGVLTESRNCAAALRKTDTVLIPGDFQKTLHQISSQHIDLEKELSRDADRYTRNLTEWPPGSPEYYAMLDALQNRVASLALVRLDKDNLPGFIAALRRLLPWTADAAADVQALIDGAEELQHEGRLPDKNFSENARCVLDRFTRMDKV
jgi:hypothetical protein